MASLEEDDLVYLGERLQRNRPRVQILDYESAQQRFPTKGEIRAPATATWRCNLAALSQRRNLFFTAQGTDIYVWIPTGINQLLGSVPEMIIHPVMNEPLAPGSIDPRRPHSINHILVDDLGFDEVLLLATDSGNVTGYNVEAIFSAINRCEKFNHKRPYDGVEVKPFFAENVRDSAWGLATHKFARLIAVTANTGKITVFAFAIVDPQIDVELPYGEWCTEESTEVGQPWVYVECQEHLETLKSLSPHHRRLNLRLSYSGHYENIPCVSFANFDLDPNGTWMVSTDISNRVMTWKVWEWLHPVSASDYRVSGNSRPERGWFVLPLDPRRVQRHSLKIDACGCIPHEAIIDDRLVYNTSGMTDNLLSMHMDSQISKTPRNREPLPDDVFSPDCLVDPKPGMSSFSAESRLFNAERRSFSVEDDIIFADEIDGIDGIAKGDSDIDSSHDNTDRHQSPSLRARRGISNLDGEDYEQFDDFNNSTWYDCDETVSQLQRHFPFHPKDPRFFPVLHFSEHDITLASYPLNSGIRIVAQSILEELVPDTDTTSHAAIISSACDRMNMVKYIPELGLIVAASQKGRVAIITITWQAEIGHSFRVDWILPFGVQDAPFRGPRVPLMGMAVSPLPGFEKPQDITCIPRDVDPREWLKFGYRVLSPEKDGSESSSESGSSHSFNPMKNKPESSSAGQNDPEPLTASPNTRTQGSDGANSSSEDPLYSPSNHTIPERHAHASGIFQPHEKWHGHHPSRHYRLLLLFSDHSVMSYEFWHTWKG